MGLNKTRFEDGFPVVVNEHTSNDDGLCHAYSEYGTEFDCRQPAGHEGNHGNPRTSDHV